MDRGRGAPILPEARCTGFPLTCGRPRMTLPGRSEVNPMSHHSKMVGVVMIGLLHLVSGIAGIAVGGASAQVGWWLVIAGLVIAGLAWRGLRDDRSGANG